MFSMECFLAARAKLSKLKKLEVLGEGVYGVVFKAQNDVTGEIVAIKQIKDFGNDEAGIAVTTMREINALKYLRHHNVIQLKDVLCAGYKSFFMVFEYFGIDLKLYLTRVPCKPDEMLVKSYTKQLMEALAFIHSNRVMHRDVKPQNVLVDSEGNLKLADFGLCRQFTMPMKNYTNKIVSLWYRAPEILFGSTMYGPKVDIWGAGCVMAEIIDFQTLFDGVSEIEQINKICKVLGNPDEGNPMLGCYDFINFKASQFEVYNNTKGLDALIKFHSQEQLKFLESIIVFNPLIRKSAMECLRMDYLKNVEKVLPVQWCFN
ncbi:PREDICTED: cyclin-dependent kinase 1-A-like [Nicrophorus vespilloides]|uniref:cyclin-dependent kinase n=1 Tax=Nicrophorus vespilloides TaxID=110193 RepID=A0ABM1MRH2_NICVS|nr:PREDICTED: cyclin-dependent kinase 1-A-like [Nicrophorus vespilloides]